MGKLSGGQHDKRGCTSRRERPERQVRSASQDPKVQCTAAPALRICNGTWSGWGKARSGSAADLLQDGDGGEGALGLIQRLLHVLALQEALHAQPQAGEHTGPCRLTAQPTRHGTAGRAGPSRVAKAARQQSRLATVRHHLGIVSSNSSSSSSSGRHTEALPHRSAAAAAASAAR